MNTHPDFTVRNYYAIAKNGTFQGRNITQEEFEEFLRLMNEEPGYIGAWRKCSWFRYTLQRFWFWVIFLGKPPKYFFNSDTDDGK